MHLPHTSMEKVDFFFKQTNKHKTIPNFTARKFQLKQKFYVEEETKDVLFFSWVLLQKALRETTVAV